MTAEDDIFEGVMDWLHDLHKDAYEDNFSPQLIRIHPQLLIDMDQSRELHMTTETAKEVLQNTFDLPVVEDHYSFEEGTVGIAIDAVDLDAPEVQRFKQFEAIKKRKEWLEGGEVDVEGLWMHGRPFSRPLGDYDAYAREIFGGD